MLGAMKDLILIVATATVAEVAIPQPAEPDVTTSMVALVPYLVLALVAAVARAFFDAHSGEIPTLAALLRSVAVAVFAGIVVAALLGEYAIAPGFRMAWVLTAAFFADSTIAAIGRIYRSQVSRAVPPQRQPDDPTSGASQ